MKTLEKKIQILRERIKRLKDISARAKSFADYQRSYDLKDMTERNVQVAIEACLDIGKIIIFKEGLKEPKDNKGIFVILGEAGIISRDLTSFLIPMAGTRNILVHSYYKIENGIMYGILKRHIEDFEAFLSEIKRNYLQKHQH